MPLLVGSCRTRSVVCLSSFVVCCGGGISLCVDVIVKSSTYEIMFILAGVGRVSCM